MIVLETYKLDRIEEEFAVLENPEKEMLSVPKEKLPADAKSGDCFIFDGENFVLSTEETKKRRNTVSALLHSIIEKL